MPENRPETASGTYSQLGNTSNEPGPPASIAIPPLTDTLTGAFLSADELDTILRDGGNERNSILHIAAYFIKDKTPAENAEFLAREYRKGGKGFQFGDKQAAVWFDETGLTLGRGKSALHTRDSVYITWEQAAVRIRELLDAGKYVSHDVFDEAMDNEHHELAERLLFFYRDDLRDFREMPEGWLSETGGFPADVAQVKELLLDKGELGEYSLILERLEEDIAALSTDTDAPKRYWHSPARMLQDIRDLGIPPLSFPAGEPPSMGFMPFITEDEVDAYLLRGGSYQSGKYRIFSYFLHARTPKERADFLKSEYGQGGQSHALSGADNSWADSEPGKGIILKRGGLSNPYDTVKLSWSAAEKRIGKMIQDGRYMTRAELDRIPEYEKDILAQNVTNFYYNLPEDIKRPYPSSNDIWDDEGKRAVRAMLDDPAKVAELLAAMKPILDGTHPDDRYYATRRTGFENLTAYQNGTYTLFPGLDGLTMPEAAAQQRTPGPVSQPYAQLSLFDLPRPILPGVEEQRAVIEENRRDAETTAPSVTESISQEEIDTLLLGAVETPEQYDRIIRQFTENPRSKETAQLIKDIYGDGAYLMPRTDGAEGYLGLLGSDTGVTFSKGDPKTVPLARRKPAVSLDLPWAKVHRRVLELVQAGRFLEAREQPHVFYSPQKNIPYRAGDAIDALSADNIHVRLVIDRIDKDYVYYTLPSEPGQEPVEMFRSRFEGYLDDGRYAVLGPEAVQPVEETEPDVKDVPAQPQTEPSVADIPPQPEQAQEPTAAAPLGRSYAVGDTVYLESDKPYIIDRIGDYDVSLQDPSLLYPIFRAESRERFERLLARNPKNKLFTDYLTADPDDAHEDLRDVLENGLLTGPDGDALARLFQSGASNSEIADYLSRTISGEAETMALNTGETADYFAQTAGLVIDVRSRFISRYSFPWGEIAPVLRGIYEREPELFGRSAQEKETTPQPEESQQQPEPERQTEPQPETGPSAAPSGTSGPKEDFGLTREDIAYIRDRLRNPTPEDIARIDEILAAAQKAAERAEKEADTHRTEPPVPVESSLPEPEIPPVPLEVQAPAAELSEPEITQADIDAALIRWNGSLDSKILVYQYMRENPRARGTAAFLREEYGGDLPAFLVIKEGAEPVNLSWPVVQRSIARMMEEERFLMPEEQTYAQREYMDFADEELPDMDEPEPEQSLQPILPPKNFRITDDHLGEGGQKTKYGYNLAAIRTLKQIEAENRYATPEEQETLSRYVGWGGIPQAFDADRDGWQKEYAELKELLTPEEYEMARASTLNAHYTSPTVIKAIYDTVGRLGFKTGNLLEPACGVGNFFGLLPESMKNARLYGVELDSITGRIAKLLYPEADIKVTGYEQTDMPDAFFDVSVSNVPFGNYPVMDKRYKQKFHVHDYFFGATR